MVTRRPNDQNHVFPESEDFQEKLEHLKSESTQETAQQSYPQPPKNLEQGATYFTNPIVDPASTPQDQYNNANTYYPGQNQSQQTYFETVLEEPQVQKPQNKDIAQTKNQGLKKITEYLTSRWWVVVGILVVLAIISVAAFSYFNRPVSYDSSAFTNVKSRIEAPSTAPSGSPTRYKVVIQNLESANLQNIEVKLNFDKAFQYTKPINPDPSDPRGNVYKFQSISGIGQGTSEIIIQFEGVLTGNIDEETLMNGVITYTPTPLVGTENSSRTIQIQGALTRITAPEISINLSSKDQSVQNGGEVELIATFENQSERDLKDIRIVANYPGNNNFTYISSELKISNADPKTTPDNSNNVWNITTLPRLQKQTLNIKGSLFGADGVKQPFRIDIDIKGADGNYKTLATDALDITVTAQPLIISTRIEGKDSSKLFSAGETLTVVIDYQNRSTVTIQNVELFALVDDPAGILDYSTLVFVGGDAGNINNRTVQWRGSGTPQLVTLTPQVKGQVRFSIRVKEGDTFLQSNLNQSSYTLRPRAQAKASNIQQFEVGGDLYKARGDLTMSQIVESETTDPVQKNKKTYVVVLEFRSRQNQVNDVRYETITELPTTAWQQVSIEPSTSSGEIQYESSTGKIIWNVGKLPGYTGISTPVKRIKFNLVVELTGNSVVPLLNSGQAKGVDDFTGEVYDLKTSELTNRLN